MATVDLIMPKLGESIMEATILKWFKQPGDSVKMDETVLEIATDKVDSEVPSTAEGVIEEILFKVNDVVPIGTVIARIRQGGEAAASAPAQTVAAPEQPAAPATQAAVVSTQTAAPAASSGGARFYSPLVLNIAASEGISMSELEQIPGTGNEGRVTKKDILQYVSQRKSGQVPAAQQPTVQAQPQQQSAPATIAPRETQAMTTYSGNATKRKKNLNAAKEPRSLSRRFL